MLRRTRFIFSFFCLFSAFSLFADDALTFVVTASRESEDIMDAPAQMTVITTEEIQSSGKTSLVQILEDAAGVSFRSYSGEAQAQVSMRGFGENSFGRVVVLVDGKKLNNPDMAGLNWQSIPLSSIEKIEILDGPSAVLYGSGAVGGVINIITKESAAGVTAGATLSYGSFNTRRAQVTGGFGTDSAGFLVSADHYSTDGFRERSESKTTNVTINGFADVTDKLTVKPSITYSDIYYQMPGSLTEAQFEDDPAQAVNQEDDGTERDFGAALLARLAVSDNFSIELPLGYMKKDRKAEMVSYIAYGSESHTDRLLHRFDAAPKATLNKALGFGAVRIITGLDFEGTILNAENYSDEKRTDRLYLFDISQFDYGPYISASVELPENFTISAGVRYTHASVNATKDKTIVYDPDTWTSAVNEAGLSKSDTYKNLGYDMMVNYRLFENLSAYAKINTLFRAPFIDEKAEFTSYIGSYSGDQFNADLVPETGYNFEIGSKYYFKSVLSSSFNIYYMTMENEIAYTSKNENLDATKRLGGNLVLALTPVKFLELNGSLGYVKASFADGINEDKIVPLVPELTANSGLAFKLPFGMKIGGDVSYTGESYRGGDTGNVNDAIAAYALYGLTASFTPPALDGKLSVNGRVDNLLDVSYVPFVYWSGFYPAAGRAITVSASYRY